MKNNFDIETLKYTKGKFQKPEVISEVDLKT